MPPTVHHSVYLFGAWSNAPVSHRSLTFSTSSPVLEYIPYSSSYVFTPTLALTPSASAASTPVSLTIPLSKLLNLGHPANQRYVLEQTAIALNVPLQYLLPTSPPRDHQRPKRPRLNSDMPMSSPFSSSPVSQDPRQKSPVQRAPQSGNGGGGYAGFVSEVPTSGWTSSRLADCLSSFAMCPPCSSYESQPTYQPISTTTTPYQDYGSVDPPMAQTSGPLQNRDQGPYAPSHVADDQTVLFACDDPSMVAQYLHNFPPLQPSRILGVQPSTSGEEMLYPEDPSRSQYLNNPEPSHVTGLGIQSPGQLTEPLSTNNVTTAALTSSVTSPPLARQTTYGDMSGRYDMLHGYGESDSMIPAGSDALQAQARSNFGVVYNPHQRTPSARRGPFKDHEKREKTAHTRRIGSCIRCRMQRIRCNLDPENEEGPCLTCKKVATNRVWRLSCLRWKITDVRLFKPGQVKGLEWTNRWKDSVVDDIGSWAASDTKVIRVTEGYTGQFIELRVRKFHPQKGDSLERSWVSNGVKKSVPIPPFAIVDMEAAKGAFDSYIKKGLVECCKRLLGPKEKLLWRTYAVGMKMMGDTSTDDKEKELLNNTLDLWMSVRLTTKSFEIVGQETLGMDRNLIKDRANPLHGRIPLPPVMGAQIDSVLIHQIQPSLRRKTLEDLQRMTQEKKQKTWLTTYIVTFILLHNIALITRHDAEYARKHGMKTRFAREDKVKEYNLGANTLLAYFHYCNKGIYPFSDECRDQDLQTLAALDDWAIRFVHDTRRYAAEHKRQWEEIWESDDYENEYYYVSQLFETNWQPRVMP
ncbi:hypothetical protein BR93DRAFT_934273 [Coniochaeta sp. PMI_546]|nr:hypothetical protein BR93DRAFT_934273 [Coniochaeta sp. PMI_546]